MMTAATTAQIDYLNVLLDNVAAKVTVWTRSQRSTSVAMAFSADIRTERRAILAEMGLTPRTADDLLKDHIEAILVNDRLAETERLAVTDRATLAGLDKAQASALIDALKAAQ